MRSLLSFIHRRGGGSLLGSHKRLKNYIFPYIKLLNEDIPFVEIKDETFKINYAQVSVHIDVYPIDGVGENSEKVRKQVNFYKRLWYVNVSKDKSKSFARNVALKIIRTIPTKFFTKKIDKIMQKYSFEKSEMVTRWRGENCVFPKSWLDVPIKLPFEDLKLNAPKEYDKYLKFVYGKYKESKRENQNIRHNINDMTYLTIDVLKKMYSI